MPANSTRSAARSVALMLFALAACGRGTNAQDPAVPVSPELSRTLRSAAHPLTGTGADYDPLLTLVGDARFVLLGEATHGSHEFYRERARISRRLADERGFTAVAVEADWPDAYRVNRFVRGGSEDATAEQALSLFDDFPEWMWRNAEVRDFVRDLRARNAARPAGTAAVGFYGLDLYSLFRSADEVVRFLERADPAAAARARERYACFARYDRAPERYGEAAASNPSASCERQATEQLAEMQRLPAATAASEEAFNARQNARVVRNAEAYYRISFRGGENTWNLRDRHMAETLDSLAAFLSRANGQPARIAVWAHNSHVGDARFTDQGEGGELTLGQLARERHGTNAVLVGFTTYAGSVIAASRWGGRAETKSVRPALPGSYETLFHETGLPNFLLLLRAGPAREPLREPRLERAIGVMYLPETERQSHYFRARLAEQFDAVIHWDQTRAVQPLR